MNNNDELDRILKDAILFKLGHCHSSFLEETEENKKNKTSSVPVTISRIQLYRAQVAHTVRGNFVIITVIIMLG